MFVKNDIRKKKREQKRKKGKERKRKKKKQKEKKKPSRKKRSCQEESKMIQARILAPALMMMTAETSLTEYTYLPISFVQMSLHSQVTRNEQPPERMYAGAHRYVE